MTFKDVFEVAGFPAVNGAPSQRNYREVVAAHGKATAEAIVEGLSSAIASFLDGTGQRDDVTMVICKCRTGFTA